MNVPALMRAAWYDQQGPADQVIKVGMLPTPTVGKGELLVAIAYSSVNPTDCNGRSGRLGREMPAARVIPHSDGSGTVAAVGADVDPSWIGRKVWIHCAQRDRPLGTAAQFCSVPLVLVAEIPETVDIMHAAGLGIPAMTAWLCLFQDGDLAGRTVLVTGGAGSVGHFAVQMARHAGARVLATVSSATKAAQALEAGAEVAINYRQDDVVSAVEAATQGRGVDHVVDVDFGAGLPHALQLLRPNGVLATYSSLSQPKPTIDAYALMRKNAVCRFVLTASPAPAVRLRAQRWINGWLANARVIHRTAGVFPLESTARAHDLVEEGGRLGAVLVEPSQPGPTK